jgi:hypothetical protein
MTASTPWTAAAFLPWAFRDIIDDKRGSDDLTGFHVEALDGRIGHIDQATYDTGSASIVVDTGPWIFGKKVLLPAGTIDNVDPTEKVVYVDRSKEQIKNAPEYDDETAADMDYRDRLGAYYGETYL